MRRGLIIGSLFFAWLCANGAMWDVVQVVAWTRMFAGYAQTLPVSEALQETFDASKPCAICRIVSDAKESGQQAPLPPAREGDKLVFDCDAPAMIFLADPASRWVQSPCAIAEPRVEPVPLPPPRA